MLPRNIKNYKWAIYRYGMYYCFIKEYYKLFLYIFLLDMRDTVFQINPQLIKFKSGILPFYNNNDSIFKKVPLNGGSIYGESYMILNFLFLLNQLIRKNYHKTSDQGIINILYYKYSSKNIKINVNHNDNGYIYYMGIELTFKSIFPNICYTFSNNLVYRRDKSIPYILHQNDREIKLLNIFKLIYSNLNRSSKGNFFI